MQNPRLASRYAKSLLDIAVEQNSVEDTLQDVQLLAAVCKQSKDFTNVLRSPVIKSDKKLSIIDAVVGKSLHTLAQAFIKLLVTKGREENLPEIAESFVEQYKQLKNIKTVKITTAVPADDKVRDAVRNKIQAAYPDALIEIEESVNADILGGLMVQMDDVMFDFSVRRDLNDVRKQFMKNIYVSQVG